ncbi:MAG TPA: hypothetical protein VHG08_14000 [Longimicrobium sp.]|nr:hypothetical protein [Longimicrobium sp.]
MRRPASHPRPVRRALLAAAGTVALAGAAAPGRAQPAPPAQLPAPREPGSVTPTSPPATPNPSTVVTTPPAPVPTGLRVVLNPPGKLTLLFNRQAPLTVVSDSLPATNLRVVHSTLQEGTTDALLEPTKLRLCVPGRCGDRIDLRPGEPKTLQLVVDPAFAAKGTFTGTVVLGADGKHPLPTFNLTVLSTTRAAQAVGAALILLGIVIALLVTVVLRQRALRLQALLPASRMAGEARAVQRKVEAAAGTGETPLPGTRERIDRLLEELRPENLEAREFIPDWITPAASPARDVGAEYRMFLEWAAGEVSVVRLVEARGFRPVAELWRRTGRPEAQRALRALDEVGAQAETAAAAATEVKRIRSELDVSLGGSGLEAMAPVGTPTVQEVLVAYQQTNASLWLIWALVAWVAGIAVLVASNSAFGVGLDYYRCFLWGLGLQVAGNQLQQLTPASVATAFSISLPKP